MKNDGGLKLTLNIPKEDYKSKEKGCSPLDSLGNLISMFITSNMVIPEKMLNDFSNLVDLERENLIYRNRILNYQLGDTK